MLTNDRGLPLLPNEVCALLPLFSQPPWFFESFVNRGDGEKSGSALIGHVFYKNRLLFPVYLSVDELAQRMLITGQTGTGKTLLAMNIIKQIVKSIEGPIFIFDYNGEYRGLAIDCMGKIFTVGGEISPLRINIFRLDPRQYYDLKDHILWLHSLLQEELSLPEPTSEFLREVLEKLYTENPDGGFTFDDLVSEIIKCEAADSASLQVKNALLRRLQLLVRGEASKVLGLETTLNLENIIDKGRVVCFDLSWLVNLESRRIITLLLLKLIFDLCYSPDHIMRGVKSLIVIDEAQEILTASTTQTGRRVVDLLRKMGVSVLALGSSPHLLDESLIRNTAIKMSFRTVDERDKAIIASSMGMNAAQKEQLGRLDNMEAFFFSPKCKFPLLLRVNIKKHFQPTKNAEIQRYARIFDECDGNPHCILSAVNKQITSALEDYEFLSVKDLRAITGLPGCLIAKVISEGQLGKIRVFQINMDGHRETYLTLLKREDFLRQLATSRILELCYDLSIPVSGNLTTLDIGGSLRLFMVNPPLNPSLISHLLLEIHEALPAGKAGVILLLSDKIEDVQSFGFIPKEVLGSKALRVYCIGRLSHLLQYIKMFFSN